MSAQPPDHDHPASALPPPSAPPPLFPNEAPPAWSNPAPERPAQPPPPAATVAGAPVGGVPYPAQAPYAAGPACPPTYGPIVCPYAGGAAPANQKPAKKKGGWLGGCSCIVGLLIFLFMIYSIGYGVKQGMKQGLPGVEAEDEQLVERTVPGYGGGRFSGGPKFAVIGVNGVIDGGGSVAESAGMVKHLTARLRRAERDANVQGVILQITSPGGTLTASDLLHAEIKRLRASRGIPVVVWVDSHAMSGGYYLAAACNEVVAAPTAMVGSIGVVITHYQVSELLEKVGVAVQPIASGDNKDFASMFRDLKPEERERLEEMVRRSHERFVDVVAEGRAHVIDRKKVAALADGRWFDADEAKEAGLVDAVGYFPAAVERLKSLAGVSDPVLVNYRPSFRLSDILQGNVESMARSAAREGVREVLRGAAEAPLAEARPRMEAIQ